MLDLKQIICRPLDVLADTVPVRGAKEESPQDEHVKGTLQQSDPIRLFSCH
jgi:hypothetical protein